MGKNNVNNVYYIDHETTLQEKNVRVIFTDNLKFDVHLNNASLSKFYD